MTHILVINPNTTASMTAKIAAAAAGAVSGTTRVRTVNPSMGPVSIEGYYDEAFAVPGVIEAVRAGERERVDAYVIACFDDTGVDAARTLARGPVLGICEAAMHCASLIAARFTVVTTLARSIPALETLAFRYGVERRCRIRAAEVPVLALEDPGSEAVSRVKAEIRRAVDEDGAEAILLGCAGMADLARDLSAELGLPVLDGVVCATALAETLVRLRLTTSKVGGYATPLAKAYTGAMAAFAPGHEEQSR